MRRADPTARRIALLITMGMVLAGLPAAEAQDAWRFETPKPFLDDLRVPVDLAFGRDGYVYFPLLTELEVRRAELETGKLDEEFVVRPEAATWELGSETGLFSIALEPGFHASGIMYLSYSSNTSGEWRNVLSRVRLLDAAGAHEEEILLTRPGGLFHNGGRLLIADGHLWWTTGDAVHFTAGREASMVAQEDGNLRGKILRLTLGGDPAPANPWGDHAYTKGHRNVFGIAWDPREERIFVTENGDADGDYLYILEEGANYGWPICEGACAEPDPAYEDPIWQTPQGTTIAPVGGAWFRDAFWWGSFNQGDLYRTSDTSGPWQTEQVHHHASDRPRLLAVAAGPDGESLWYSTYESIWRIPFPSHAAHPRGNATAPEPYWWELPGGGAPREEPDAAFTPGPGAPYALLALLLVLMEHVRRGHPPRSSRRTAAPRYD